MKVKQQELLQVLEASDTVRADVRRHKGGDLVTVNISGFINISAQDFKEMQARDWIDVSDEGVVTLLNAGAIMALCQP